MTDHRPIPEGHTLDRTQSPRPPLGGGVVSSMEGEGRTAATIHRGRTFRFDLDHCQCEDTEGHIENCPICVPEMFTDPDRLLDWLTETPNRTGAAHVYQVAREWLDPIDLGADTRAVQLEALIAEADPRLEGWLQPGDPDAPIYQRKFTSEATQILLGGDR